MLNNLGINFSNMFFCLIFLIRQDHLRVYLQNNFAFWLSANPVSISNSNLKRFILQFKYQNNALLKTLLISKYQTCAAIYVTLLFRSLSSPFLFADSYTKEQEL